MAPEQETRGINQYPSGPVIQVSGFAVFEKESPEEKDRRIRATTKVEKLLGPEKMRGPFRKQLGPALRANAVNTSQGLGFRNSSALNLIGIGGLMEDNVELLRATTAELEEARRAYETLANDVQAVGGVIRERLADQVLQLRSARMTAVSETQLALTALRDVRAFFLESDYETEIARLERFVALCRELMALKEQGVLDAVCDSALRLAVKS